MIKYFTFILFIVSMLSLKASDSKLNTGEWHKIAVSQDGVYKITFSFIQQNITNNPSSVAFNKFGIFGQGMGMLPEENADPRVDDIVEMPIKIFDANNNGVWNNGDYILFYAKGPDLWNFNPNNKSWWPTKNFYSDVATYFLTTSSGNGLAIPTAPNLPLNATVYDEYNHWQVYEEDENNLLYTEQASTAGSGRVWYGPPLNNISPSKNIAFNIPNIVANGQAELNTKFAAASIVSSNFSIKNNGTTLITEVVPSVGSGSYPPVAVDRSKTTPFIPGSSVNIDVEFSNADPQAVGWIDYVAVMAKANLQMNGSWFAFRNFDGVDVNVAGETSSFLLNGANANTEVWNVTSPSAMQKVSGSLIGSQLRFTVDSDDFLPELVAVNTSSTNFDEPGYISEVENQNLHGLAAVDMIIITNPTLTPAAERIKTLHTTEDNLAVEIVMIDEIYNEFSSGQMDLTAIRDFLKMLYDEGLSSNDNPKYCLLMGDASFDYKNKYGDNENIVPTYESPESLSTLDSYATDDYIGFLDDNEGGRIDDTLNPDLLDIAIGRIPVNTLKEANEVVDKILHYLERPSHGDWLNDLTFVADDEDNNLHFGDTEDITQLGSIENKDYYNFDKIYIDTYNQVNSAGGDRYPDVNDAILRKFFQGSFLINYVGHGGIQNWAQERIFNIDDIRNLDNIDNLPLMITATCDFAPFDDPGFHSAGETLLTNPDGGAIAMISTTRLVFSSSNKQINSNVMDYLFQEYEGRMPTIGEVVMQAKIATASTDNNRKFALLGDPALTLSYPKHNVVTTEINGQSIGAVTDTIKALSLVTIKGQIEDNGVLMTDFNGVVFPTVFDKPTTYVTQGQDPKSQAEEYELQNNVLFKGKSSVVNGEFEFSFIVPKDINYAFENGKITYYALKDDEEVDAHGYTYDFIVGGTDENYVEDNEGPQVDLFINDLSFVKGGVTDEDPLLIVELYDESGFNTVGTGVGHDITALLNLNTQEKFLLNDYYESALDDFTSGTVTYPFNNLPDGTYRIDAKAWDVHNNPGEGFTEFVVVSSELLAVENLMNYPNPFSYQTTFVFEHNRPGQMLDILIQVYDYSGNLVKTINETIQPEGTRLNSELTWDGSSDFGAPLSKGAYIYRLTVGTEDGLSAQEIEKLIILR